MTAPWRAALEDARRPATPVQLAWDSHWRRWWERAIQQGRAPNAACGIAWTRTEDQYGNRPSNEEIKP